MPSTNSELPVVTPIKSFGFLINSLNNSKECQLLCNNINLAISEAYLYSPIIFFQNYGYSVGMPRCCQLQQHHAWGFPHPLVSTSIETTQTLTECLRPCRKFFYVYNLEWTKPENLQHSQYSQYSYLSKIYQNPEIELIAKNEEDFRLLTNIWKKPAGIVRDYNYKEFLDVLFPPKST